MPAATPYRMRAIEMAMNGVRPAHIAAELGVSRMQVYNLLANARRCGIDIPRYDACGCADGTASVIILRTEIDRVYVPALDLAARRRRISRTDLCRRLIETMVADSLIDGILDDGVRSDG